MKSHKKKNVKFLGSFPTTPSIYGLKQPITERIQKELDITTYTYYNTVKNKMYIFEDGEWREIRDRDRDKPGIV